MATDEESPVILQQKTSAEEELTSRKKRRKVNHACIYCQRSHMTCDLARPCQRCLKRNIGHLCHDEPREAKHKPEKDKGFTELIFKQELPQPDGSPSSLAQQQTDQSFMQDAAGQISASAAMQQNIATQALRSSSNSVGQEGGHEGENQRFTGYGDWSVVGQSQFNDVPNFPSYIFNAPDITDEYNVLNEFLSSSLLDDRTLFSGDATQGLNSEMSLINTLAASTNGTSIVPLQQEKYEEANRPNRLSPTQDVTIVRPKSARPEKDEEKLYMTIADPSGNDTPQARMNKLLEAKYKAGMLKPFSYVQGYARLGKYMDSHLQPVSRQKILRQLDRFRPKFRERMQKLTDMQLMLVEMWFERKLMEYDRVFASMAVPACAWRRTGEIFRGNKEMAELIHVPIDKLRDGKIALHEIVAENDLVSYWDNFLAIAFDNSQKGMLTTCHLKNPDDKAPNPEIKCCFSFTIRRDAVHNIPSLIIGNFMPQVVRKL